MSRDGYLPPGVEHSDSHFHDDPVTCECGHPVESHGPAGMDPCEEEHCFCPQFEIAYPEDDHYYDRAA